MILQSPFGGYEHVGRRLAGKAFHDDFGTQAFEIAYHHIGIFVGSEQAERVCIELPCEARAANYLQLVYLQNVDGQRRHYGSLAYVLLRVLAGESENDVCARCYAAAVGALYGFAAALERVSAVDAPQGIVVYRLNAVFHGCEAVPRQTLDIVEHLVAHAVRARADDQSHDVFNGESLLILALYVVECAVGVAVSLEVGEVFHVGILACEEPFALFKLLRYALFGLAVGGIERAVVAKGTAA